MFSGVTGVNAKLKSLLSYLVQFEGHPDPWSYTTSQHLHVSEDPLIPYGRDTKVSLEEGVQTIQEGL